ncbi:hypothetical protein ACFL5V_13455, partial [Fibrobacterota bacterium]
VDSPRVNSLLVDEAGNLQAIEDEAVTKTLSEIRKLTYSGVALYHHSFLEFCENRNAHIREFWEKAQQAGKRISVRNCAGSSWYDFGNPQGLWEAAHEYMKLSGNRSYNYPTPEESIPWVSNEAGIPDLPPGLRNVLVYETPDKPITAGLANCVLGRDFSWPINQGT